MKQKTALCAKLTPIVLAIATFSANAANTANTANTANNTDILDTIIVTSHSTNTTISDVASVIWVIGQEEVEREINSGTDLKGALGRLIPGYDFGGESRTNNAQNMRGRTALVMIDGISLNSTRGISRQLDSISPFNIGHIEVLSGATSIYGSGASGGIINIITKKAVSDDIQVEVAVGTSSGFNSSEDFGSDIAVAISGGSETLRGRISASYEKTGASYDANGDMILPDITQTDLQFNETIDLMGNVEFQPDDNQLLSVTAQYYNSTQDTDYSPDLGANLYGAFGYLDITISDELDLEEQPSTERIMLNAQYSNKDVFNHTLLAQAYFRSEEMQFFPFPSADSYYSNPYGYLYSASLQKTDAVGASLVLSKVFDSVSLNYGVDAELESFSAESSIYDIANALSSGGLTFDKTGKVERYPGVDTQKIGLFAQADWDVMENLKVSGGLRYQHTSHDIGDFIGISQQLIYGDDVDVIKGGTTSYNELLANIGAVFSITEQQQIFTNFSQGFEIPDPAKYYGNGTYSGTTLVDSITVENGALSGVKTNSIELGWRLNESNYNVQAAAYYSLSDKTTSYDSDTYAILVNDDQKRIYGIEGQANYHFTNTLYAGVQAHILDNETKSDGSWSALGVETASASSATIRGGFDNDDYGVELKLQTIADYSDDNGNTVEGYSLMHLSSYYTLPVGKVNFGIQNLLNKDYYTTWSQRAQVYYGGTLSENLFKYKGSGRKLTLSYSAKF